MQGKATHAVMPGCDTRILRRDAFARVVKQRSTFHLILVRVAKIDQHGHQTAAMIQMRLAWISGSALQDIHADPKRFRFRVTVGYIGALFRRDSKKSAWRALLISIRKPCVRYRPRTGRCYRRQSWAR